MDPGQHPYGGGRRTAGCSQIKKAKKKKKKEKSHQFGFEDLDQRNVRPGETRNQQQHGPKAFVCIQCPVSQALFFSS